MPAHKGDTPDSVGGLGSMKLTSFRAKDETHLKDLDEAGLITAEMEGGLPGVLLEKLRRIRERE